MTSSKGPTHVVVDGSNIATEGRSLPSLAQLSEAVMAFMDEYPNTSVTVVVDATFGHRIDKSEVKEFEEGIANNELVAPPAGAVGRGDAFVLAIAQKSNASILSNDSFQEFHGDYEWLFDDGRLIGGKPVPHVGWVFVDRVPVRGPVSRKATGGSSRGGGSRRGSKKDSDKGRSGRKASAEAMEPMPVPKSPPPGRQASKASEPVAAASKPANDGGRRERPPKAGEVVNELMPFLEFVEHHPVGTSVNGTVESYSSHGAYISIGENGVRGYVPLRLMANPAPTSARKMMKIGESVTLVVVSFAPLRRSIDCAMPDMADAAIAEAKAEQAAEAAAERTASTGEEAPAKRPAKKRAAKKKAPAEQPEAREAPAKKQAPAKKAAAKKKAPAKKAAAKKAPAKQAAAKKAPAKKAAAKKAPARKAPATTAAAKKTPANTTTARNTAAAKSAPSGTPDVPPTPAKKTAAKKSAAKKAPAKRAPAKKTAAKKAPAKKTAAKKSSAIQPPAAPQGD
jgi:hypothetical protein